LDGSNEEEDSNTSREPNASNATNLIGIKLVSLNAFCFNPQIFFADVDLFSEMVSAGATQPTKNTDLSGR
jgi:hypothetical protein